MMAVNCQDTPAGAPPFGVVRDDAEGKLAGGSGGLSGASAPHFSGVECSTALPPIQTVNAWDVLCGEGDLLTDAREWVKQIEENAGIRSAATLRCLDRMREALAHKDEAVDLNDTVSLSVRDALLLSRQMLSRLR